jgi:hypothetical protein
MTLYSLIFFFIVVQYLQTLWSSCRFTTAHWKLKLIHPSHSVFIFPKEEVHGTCPVLIWTFVVPLFLGLTALSTWVYFWTSSCFFANHIEYVLPKTERMFRIFYSLLNRKSKMNTKNKLVLYKVALRSILIYFCPSWTNCVLTHKKKIQIMQNKYLKKPYLTYHGVVPFKVFMSWQRLI